MALAACGFASLAQAQSCPNAVSTTVTVEGSCTGPLTANSGGIVTGTTGVQITTADDDAYGIYVLNGGAVTLSGSDNTVTTDGINGDGLRADGGTITASNIAILVDKDSAQGAWVTYGSAVDLTDATIKANGSAETWSYGIRLYGYNLDYPGVTPPSPAPTATLTGNNLKVDAVTWGAVLGGGNTTLTLTNGSTLNSTTRGGLYVSDDGTDNNVANLTDSTVTSQAMEAAHIETGGTLNATNSAFTGATNAIVSADGMDTSPDVIKITGGTLTAQGGDAILSTGSYDDITLVGKIAVDASTGNLLNVDATSTANLTATGGTSTAPTTFTGNIQTASGGISNVTLDSASNWTITGTGSTITSLTGPGTVTIDEAAGSDILTITGAVIGTPTLKVANLPSSLVRSDSGKEIPVVRGAASPTSFSLGNASGTVILGGYFYTLNSCTLAPSAGDVCLIRGALAPVSTVPIPTMNKMGLALLGLALATLVFWQRRRRQRQ